MIVNIVPNEENKTASENERKIIRTAVLNINVLLNALLIGKGMVSNPIEEEPDNLGYVLQFEEKLSSELETQLSERIERQIGAFLLIAEVPYHVVVEN